MPQKWGFKVGLVLSYWVFIFVLLDGALPRDGAINIALGFALIVLTLPLGVLFILLPIYIHDRNYGLSAGIVIAVTLINTCVLYGLYVWIRRMKL
jgi:hypothetical protein